MRIYLDSAVIIYLVEGDPVFSFQVERRLAEKNLERITSDLTRMEVKVLPLRAQNTVLLSAYDEYFSTACAEVLDVTSAILERATRLRARHRFLKTPDAIHLASALEAGCGVFLTNDHDLARVTEMPVEVIG